MILGERELLQLGLSPLQLIGFLLQPGQQLLSVADSCPLLDPDQLPHLEALQLYGPDQLREDLVAALDGCSSRPLGWVAVMMMGVTAK